MNKLLNINKAAILTSLLFFFAVVIVMPTTIHAQETDSTTETEATESGSFENIKQIIKENIENSKVKGAIDNLLNRKIGMIGEITRVTDETITISNRLGTRIIPIPEDVSITKTSKPVTVSDIAVENWVTILGKIKDDNFTPVFISVSTKSLRPKTQFVAIGTITEIGKNTLTIIPRSSTDEKEISLVKGTTYEDLNGEEISLSDLSEDITILISGYQMDDGTEAATIRSIAELSEN